MSTALAVRPRPLFEHRLRFIKPTLSSLESILPTYEASFADGMLTNAKVVRRLEDEICERLQVRHCVAVSSCTLGLVLVLRALDLQGEVIVPSSSFFVTGQALLWNNLRPVFADSHPKTWTVDVADVQAKLTESTRAVVAVHLYGNPAPVEQLQDLCGQHGLKLVFDAAHAFGSLRDGRPVGGFGDAEVFSLTPTKLLVAGEGGLVCTNDATLARLVRVGRNYGDAGDYNPRILGLNARMTEFNASMALNGLTLVEGKVRRRNDIANRYRAQLRGVSGIQFQYIRSEDRSAYKDLSIMIEPKTFGRSRDELAEGLLTENIETRKYFDPPIHRQELFRDHNGYALPFTEQLSERVLSLPIYESLLDDEVDRVALAIRRFGGKGEHYA